jgi:hypothetical protein
VTVPETLLVAVSITLTTPGLLLKFATYTWRPSGVTATPAGPYATGAVGVTRFVEVSITETIPGSVPVP